MLFVVLFTALLARESTDMNNDGSTGDSSLLHTKGTINYRQLISILRWPAAEATEALAQMVASSQRH